MYKQYLQFYTVITKFIKADFKSQHIINIFLLRFN